MKNILALSLVSVLSSQVLANTSLANDLWDGPYVGGSIGYSAGDSKLNFINSPVGGGTTTVFGPNECQTAGRPNALIVTPTLGNIPGVGDIFGPELLTAANVTPAAGTPGMGAIGGQPFNASFFTFDPVAVVDSRNPAGCTEISDFYQLIAGGFATQLAGIDGMVVPGAPTTTMSTGFTGPLATAGAGADAATLAAVGGLSGTGRSVHINGITGTVFAGYGMVYNSVYWGAEGSLGFGDVDGTERLGQFTIGSQLDRTATAAIRIGLPQDNWMPFIKAGLAFGHGQMTYSINGVSVSDSQSHFGAVVGAGAEWAFNDNVSARLEYDYTHLGKETYFKAVGYDVKQGFGVHAVKLGIVIRN